MDWYLRFIIYVVAVFISMVSMYWVDWAKIIRSDKRQYAVTVYVLVSLGVAFMAGSLFVELGKIAKEAI